MPRCEWKSIKELTNQTLYKLIQLVENPDENHFQYHFSDIIKLNFVILSKIESIQHNPIMTIYSKCVSELIHQLKCRYCTGYR